MKETKIVTAHDNDKNDENVSMLVDAKADVLLQTGDYIISNPSETKSLKVKVLLNPGFQNVQIKAFGDTKGQLKELGEFKFVF